MLAFALAGHGDLVPCKFKAPNLNLTAYATRNTDGTLFVVVINKDETQVAAVETILPKGYTRATVLRLSGPSLTSQEDVTFAGTPVAADGTWASWSARKCSPFRMAWRTGPSITPAPPFCNSSLRSKSEFQFSGFNPSLQQTATPQSPPSSPPPAMRRVNAVPI